MTLGVFLAVLGAAFLHALWNALIKLGTSKVGGMVILSIVEVPIGLAVASFRPFPAAEVWPWVLAAGCTHFFYKFFLTYAYDRGDLSRVYPIARGAAPMIVAIRDFGPRSTVCPSSAIRAAVGKSPSSPSSAAIRPASLPAVPPSRIAWPKGTSTASSASGPRRLTCSPSPTLHHSSTS